MVRATELDAAVAHAHAAAARVTIEEKLGLAGLPAHRLPAQARRYWACFTHQGHVRCRAFAVFCRTFSAAYLALRG